MNSSWVRLVLVTGLALSVQAQTSSNPPPSNTISPPPAPFNRPPSPSDAPLPDLGSLPYPAKPTKSKIKRALDRLTPNCAHMVYHSCWSSPAQDSSARLPEAELRVNRLSPECAHSYLRANAGSTCIALCAGRYAAIKPVAATSPQTPANTIGLRAPVP
jgi:hypothetical protein